jgi:hypothetical protein
MGFVLSIGPNWGVLGSDARTVTRRRHLPAHPALMHRRSQRVLRSQRSAPTTIIFFPRSQRLFVPAPITIIFLLFYTINFFIFSSRLFFPRSQQLFIPAPTTIIFYFFPLLFFLFFPCSQHRLFFPTLATFPCLSPGKKITFTK